MPVESDDTYIYSTFGSNKLALLATCMMFFLPLLALQSAMIEQPVVQNADNYAENTTA